MTALEQRIKSYADAYYQGNEQISDAEYDALIEQLRRETPKSELLPENQGIAGSDLKGVSKKYKLPVTMGTLAKCNTDEEFKEWWSKHSHDDIVVESKIDGCGVLLEYEDGKLVRAYSRGDSVYAEDRTAQMDAVLGKTNSNVSKGFYGWIRGEVVLKRSLFNKHFKEKGYKNPRNMVSGLLGRESLSDEDLKELGACSFIAYDVFTSPRNKTGYPVNDTELHKLMFLQSNKLEVPEVSVNPDFSTIKSWKDSIDTSNDEIPCDGIVIKQNKVDIDDLMRKTPLNNVAYKPNLDIAVTKVVSIEWSLSGRYLSPVAIVEPVELCGTTVSRASLANINKMEELGIEIGSTVEIVKRGEIIPKIMKVVA